MELLTLISLAAIAPIPLFHLVLHAWLPVWRQMPRAYYVGWVVLWVVSFALAWANRATLLASVLTPPDTTQVIGILLLLAAVLLIASAIATLGVRRFFVYAVLVPGSAEPVHIVGGPYRVLAHPAYHGYHLAAFGLFLLTGAWGALLLLGWLLVLTPLVIRLEERELAERTSTVG